MGGTTRARDRRPFTKEYKQEAVRLLLENGRSGREVLLMVMDLHRPAGRGVQAGAASAAAIPARMAEMASELRSGPP